MFTNENEIIYRSSMQIYRDLFFWKAKKTCLWYTIQAYIKLF